MQQTFLSYSEHPCRELGTLEPNKSLRSDRVFLTLQRVICTDPYDCPLLWHVVVGRKLCRLYGRVIVVRGPKFGNYCPGRCKMPNFLVVINIAVFHTLGWRGVDSLFVLASFSSLPQLFFSIFSTLIVLLQVSSHPFLLSSLSWFLPIEELRDIIFYAFWEVPITSFHWLEFISLAWHKIVFPPEGKKISIATRLRVFHTLHSGMKNEWVTGSLAYRLVGWLCYLLAGSPGWLETWRLHNNIIALILTLKGISSVFSSLPLRLPRPGDILWLCGTRVCY